MEADQTGLENGALVNEPDGIRIDPVPVAATLEDLPVRPNRMLHGPPRIGQLPCNGRQVFRVQEGVALSQRLGESRLDLCNRQTTRMGLDRGEPWWPRVKRRFLRMTTIGGGPVVRPS